MALSSKSFDFVLAFPQADLNIPVYMELPIDFDASDGESCKFYVLRLIKKSSWIETSWLQLVCKTQ